MKQAQRTENAARNLTAPPMHQIKHLLEVMASGEPIDYIDRRHAREVLEQMRSDADFREGMGITERLPLN